MKSSDLVGGKNLDVEEIWGVARLLFDLTKKLESKRGQLGESVIDGAFFLTFFEPTFTDRVKAIRRNFWDTDKPPLPIDPSKLHWPSGGTVGIAEYRSPDWSNEEFGRFSNEVISLQEKFGIPGYVEETVLYGIPPSFPYIKYLEQVEVFSDEAKIELHVFSARTRGKHLARLYKERLRGDLVHVPHFPVGWSEGEPQVEFELQREKVPQLPCIVLRVAAPWPKPTVIEKLYETQARPHGEWLKQLYCGHVTKTVPSAGRLRAKQWAREQIRAWAVYTAEKLAMPSIRETLRLFYHEFPDEMYAGFDPSSTETQSADIRYQQDRALLFQRLPSLKP